MADAEQGTRNPLFESAISSFAPSIEETKTFLTPWVRFLGAMSLHFAGFFFKILLAISFHLFSQEFFIVLVCLWMLVSVFYTVAIASDETFLKGWSPALRLPFLFFVFGMLQGAPVKHILDTYFASFDCLEDGEEHKPKMNSKTFDAIIEGIPFAFLGLTAAFLMDRSQAICPWYLTTQIASTYESIFGTLTVLFFMCGWVSILTLVFGVMELDYRVSQQVRELMDSSPISAGLHFLHRASEVAFHLLTYILGYVFVRYLIPNDSTDSISGMLFYPLPVVVVWLIRVVLLVCVSPRGDHFLSHLLVAIAAIVVNPGKFVDTPAHVSASRRVTIALEVTWCAEIAAIAAAVALVWGRTLPDGCRVMHSNETTIGLHVLEWEQSLFFQWAVSAVFYVALTATRNLRIGKKIVGGASLSDAMVLEMIPDHTKGDNGMRVRSSARGFSSYLLTVGTGLTSTLFEKEEQQLADFVIEKVLGKGSYGVVCLVRLRQAKSSTIQEHTGEVKYAMKLQNTESVSTGGIARVLPSRDMAATREANILQAVKHPFVVRLVSFFEVPDKEWRDSSTGEIVTDTSGNKRFHKAIVMEFCPGGDLDNYILSQGLAPGTRLPGGRPLSDGALTWMVRARRFAAEMCVGIAFLHSKHIIYRDLKPQNVLLKSGFDDELHICFTDFGFSKKVGGGTASASNRLDSLAGTPLFAAPEIMTIAEKQLRHQYTPSVDLYSLGKTILVTLWRTKMYDHSEDLMMPDPQEYRNDPRVPRPAQQMIDKLVSRTPETRGRADQLFHQTFFSEIKINSETRPVLPAINWITLEQYAW